MTKVDSIYVGRFDQNLAAQRMLGGPAPPGPPAPPGVAAGGAAGGGGGISVRTAKF
jgi:hypothetical protein